MVTEVTQLSRIRTSERDRAALAVPARDREVDARSPQTTALRRSGFRNAGHIRYQIILKIIQNIEYFKLKD